jgi:hypothetical protein
VHLVISLLRRTRDLAHFRFERWRARMWTRYFSQVVFVHINKTGGSSMERALGLPFQHLTAMEFRDLMGRRRFERAFRFTVVRDPFAKVASHYRYRVRTNQTGLGERPVPFSEWVIRAYGEQDPHFYDQPRMFAPQIEWLREPNGPLLVDYVARFEKLHDDFAEVCRRLEVSASLPHLKSSRQGEPVPSRYDDASASVVRRVFREDFEAFGYSLDLQTGESS